MRRHIKRAGFQPGNACLTASAMAGLSLIELMIALTLGTLLVLGIANVFLSNRESVRVESALSRLQQSGRVAVELLNKDVRRAGYQGCNSIASTIDVAASGVTINGLRAYTRPTSGTALAPDSTGTVAHPLRSIARPGSDILVIDYAEFLGDNLLSGTFQEGDQTVILQAPTGTPTPQPQCQLQGGDLAVFSNCLTSHVFRVSGAGSCTAGAGSVALTLSPGDNANPLVNAGFRYTDTAEVAEFFQVIWYVADTGRDRNGVDVFALYRLDTRLPVSRAEEMVEGVEFLQVELGQSVAGNLRLVPPETPGLDWARVNAVHYALLVTTHEPIASDDDDASYQLLSTSVGPSGVPSHSGGRFVRRVFTHSQAIRNRPYDS